MQFSRICIIHVKIIIIRLKHKTDAVRVTHVYKCVYRSGNDNNNIRTVSLAGAYDGCAGWGGGDRCGWEGKSIVLYASRPRYEIKVRENIFIKKQNILFYHRMIKHQWHAANAGAIIQ
jgi:hypothetical protein